MVSSFFKHPLLTRWACLIAVSFVALILLFFSGAVLTLTLWGAFNISYTSFELWQNYNHLLPSIAQTMQAIIILVKMLGVFMVGLLLFMFAFSMTYPRPKSTMR